jgi:hypothetical protein
MRSWIFFDGRTPYILRRMGTEYYFLGELYINGFTYGELFLRDKENGFDLTIKEVVITESFLRGKRIYEHGGIPLLTIQADKRW